MSWSRARRSRIYRGQYKNNTPWLRRTHVRRVFEEALGDGVLEALQVLVKLALVFQKHRRGRLEVCISAP